MEEPLLGPKTNGLLKIPEESVLQGTPEVPITSSTIKQQLIFGCSHALPNDDRPPPHGPSGTQDVDEQPLISNRDEDICTCRHPAVNDLCVADAHIDKRTIGPHRSEPRLISTFTKLDLGLGAPLTALSSSPIAAWLLREKEAARKHLSERCSDRCFHQIVMPMDFPSSINCSSCRKHNLHRARTAPALTGQGGKHRPQRAEVLGPTFSIVSQAFIGLLLYLAVGVLIYTLKEDDFSGSSTHYLIDAIYFCIVTMCTIGYGDITPTTPAAKLFSCAFVLVGFGFIDILLTGMVAHVLDRQEALLLNAVAAGQHETAKNYLVDLKKGRMRIRSKVSLAFGVVIMCIGVGTLVLHFLESLGWVDSFYLSCMSVTTVGYGDHAFKTMSGRLFASVWLLVSTLAVARSFLFLAEARIERRHRLIAKLVLEKEMTIGELFAADFDNDGCVSKSDFVLYKLKQMGKILDKDIAEICKQFSRLDRDRSGKISLSCLINLHKASAALR